MIYKIISQEFLDARWLSSIEAAHEIMAYPVNMMYPSVTRLQVHLPGEEMCAFKDTNRESVIFFIFILIITPNILQNRCTCRNRSHR